MCTVTLIARKRGYALGMNRDEKLSRPKGLKPAIRHLRGRTVLSPSEPAGGTWIAINDRRITFALINWYSVARTAEIDPESRGVVINQVITTDSPDAAHAALAELSLKHINPFRLIGVFPGICEVIEWRWDLKRLVRRNFSWRTRQWVSSGFNETTAQRIRGMTFRRLATRSSAGTIAWLRRLHRSHSPASGPFSTCMHRADAATVSYTEVAVNSSNVKMGHVDSAPCKCASAPEQLRMACPMNSAVGISEIFSIRARAGHSRALTERLDLTAEIFRSANEIELKRP